MKVKLDDVTDQVLSAARDFEVEAEAYAVSNNVLTVRLMNNGVFEAKAVHDIGVSVRVADEHGLGFSSTSNLDEAAIKNAVASAVNVAKKRELPFKMSFLEPAKPSEVEGLYDKKLAELDSGKAVELAYAMINSSLGYSKKIFDNAGVLKIVDYAVFIQNSNGLRVSDRGTFFESGLTARARDNGKITEGADMIGGRNLRQIRPEDVGKNAAEMAIGGLKAKPLKDDVYPIVFGFEAVAEIIAFLCALTSPVFSKMSYPLLINKVGEKVASEEISFYDDQTMPGGYGSCRIDDEGNPARKIPIIEKGVFNTFLYDVFNAKLEGKKVTGGACRSLLKLPPITGTVKFAGKSYIAAPDPVALNPVLASGDSSSEEIIKETKKGLLAKSFHYSGLTNPTRGDFTSILRMGLYQIENGEVVGTVTKSILIDNLLDILKNVDMVSKELRVSGSWFLTYATVPMFRSKSRVLPTS
jgi:PmbA protein